MLMNDFTKEELQLILLAYWGSPYCMKPDKDELHDKIESMIDNYCEHNEKWIAKNHLKEASSLISHAMCLLGMDNDNQ